MSRKKNTEAIVQIIILIAIACLLIYAMISKKVTYYVHPRFYFGIWVSIIILILFALSIISKVKKSRHNVNVRHYTIFVIPLAAALIFPAAGVSNKNMTMVNNDTITSNSEQETNNTQNKENTEDDVNSDNENSNNYEEKNSTSETNSEDVYEGTTSDVSEKYTQYEVDGVMVINDDIFAEWLGDVYDNLDDFVGKKCQYVAQVYSMDDLKENQFLAGRYFMVCCVADLVGYGIVCESDERSELQDDEWITVTGTIEKYDHNGDTVPLLTNVTITKAEAPSVEYIYFNNY